MGYQDRTPRAESKQTISSPFAAAVSTDLGLSDYVTLGNNTSNRRQERHQHKHKHPISLSPSTHLQMLQRGNNRHFGPSRAASASTSASHLPIFSLHIMSPSPMSPSPIIPVTHHPTYPTRSNALYSNFRTFHIRT